MRSWEANPWPLAWVLVMLLLPVLSAQNSGNARGNVAVVQVKGPVVAKRAQSVTVPVIVKVTEGYHVTSASPGDRYLKPLRLVWETGALHPGTPQYPEPVMMENAETKTKLSVYEGTFTIQQAFQVPANTPQGFGAMMGTLRYQACTRTECYPPATIPVRMSYDIR